MDFDAFSQAVVFGYIAGSLIMVIFLLLLYIKDRTHYLLAFLMFWTILLVAYAMLYTALKTDYVFFAGLYFVLIVIAMPSLVMASIEMAQRKLYRTHRLLLYGSAPFVIILSILSASEFVRGLIVFGYTGLLFIGAGGIALLDKRLFLRLFGYAALLTGLLNLTFPFLAVRHMPLFHGFLSLSGGLMALSVLLAHVSTQLHSQQTENISLRHDNIHDSLTKTKNRNYLDHMALLLDQDTTANYSLLVCDLNNLKEINDKHGHLIGDKLIKTAAEVLLEAFSIDAVCRFGGDEFVVILKDHDYDQALKAKDHASRLAETKSVKGFKLEMAFGVATRKPTETFVEVFTWAEKQMYHDKGIKS